MSAKQRTRPTAATVKRAETETAAFGEAAISCIDCTSLPSGSQFGIIAKLLSHGAENGLTLSDLHRLTGINKRVIRAEIQQERLSGVPILSNNADGYYLPANEDEREQCVRSLRHRADEILKSAAAIEGAAVLD